MAIDQQTVPGNGSVVADILHDAQELFKQQLAMFRAEIQEDFRKTRQVAIFMVLGAAVGMIGVFILGLMLAHLLHWGFEIPLWVAHGLVALVMLLAGGGLIFFGKKRLETFNPLPDKTAEAAKENVQWLTRPK